ncbi:MAG: SEC-C metal-binding domain-containing protein [Actinomycetota bacterium]
MPKITYPEALRQIDDLEDRIRKARDARDPESELAAYRDLAVHPCTRHELDLAHVHDEIHQLLRKLGRYDEAIEAKRAAIDAGYRSNPDPEADIAETLMAAGRRDEADALYAELRQRDPEDVWLYNSAAFAYQEVDDREALRWLLDGIEVAIETGDPDQVIGQLLDLTEDAWDRLGEAPDTELVARVKEFQMTWRRPSYRPRFPIEPASWEELARCRHCGFDPDRPPPEADIPGWPLEPIETGDQVAVSLAWFPADEWAEARGRWPELREDLPEDHTEYSHRLEAQLKRYAPLFPGDAPTVSPLTVEELISTEGDRAGTPEARSRLAAEVARTGRALAWPPGRNQPCWCGSGQKYKKCCGPVAAARDSE